MPHFTIEYSANLDERLDMAEVVDVVRRAAVETGILPLGGIRVRAVRYEHYAIADGRPAYGFLDMVCGLVKAGISPHASMSRWRGARTGFNDWEFETPSFPGDA
jgi:5-carboxymethyl-2-hydroxymuconate isomerase